MVVGLWLAGENPDVSKTHDSSHDQTIDPSTSSNDNNKGVSYRLQMREWKVKPSMTSFQYVWECRKRGLKYNKQSPSGNRQLLADNASKILQMMDHAYRTGSLADQSAYLVARRDWAMETI